MLFTSHFSLIFYPISYHYIKGIVRRCTEHTDRANGYRHEVRINEQSAVNERCSGAFYVMFATFYSAHCFFSMFSGDHVFIFYVYEKGQSLFLSYIEYEHF